MTPSSAMSFTKMSIFMKYLESCPPEAVRVDLPLSQFSARLRNSIARKTTQPQVNRDFHRHSRWLYIQQQSSSSSGKRFIEHDVSTRKLGPQGTPKLSKQTH